MPKRKLKPAENFDFTDDIQNQLQEYIEENFSPYPFPIIRNVIEYTAIQGLSYDETEEMLLFLLDRTGITPSEIRNCLLAAQ